jgi:hypothetical protein
MLPTFIAALSKAALSCKKRAFAGTSHDNCHTRNAIYMGFQVLTVLKKIQAFWDVMLCRLANNHRRFERL